MCYLHSYDDDSDSNDISEICSPIFTHLAGSIGTWKSLSPQVIQASFNVDADVEKQFRSKRTSDAIFFPPPK